MTDPGYLHFTDYEGPYGEWIHPTLVRKVPNGAYFRTVRVPHDTGLAVLKAHPGLESGPVIVNPFARIVVFLLPPGTHPEHWIVPGTRFLRPGVTVEIPPAAAVRCRDIHWLTPPGSHRDYLVSDLVAALTGQPAPPHPLPRGRAGAGAGRRR
ncbi:hypothetical protein [Streptomyces tsukubensis]|uniref:hypothetical protein n=1 Tax=Streptomyces tsukubensis TaxID=83656 RepID=UPI00344B9FDB